MLQYSLGSNGLRLTSRLCRLGGQTSSLESYSNIFTKRVSFGIRDDMSRALPRLIVEQLLQNVDTLELLVRNLELQEKESIENNP